MTRLVAHWWGRLRAFTAHAEVREFSANTGWALAAYGVMEKRDGWGKEYAEAMRNGEWEYQAYTAAKAVNDKANLKSCFECHKPKAGDDFLFSLGMMKSHK